MADQIAAMPPIVYPRIDIPGKGIVELKYDLHAIYVIDEKYNITEAETIQIVNEWLPGDGPDGSMLPGRVRPSHLFKLLSGCIWSTCPMLAQDLAKLFEYQEDMASIALAVAETVSKLRWSRRPMAPTTNGRQEPAEPANPNYQKKSVGFASGPTELQGMGLD